VVLWATCSRENGGTHTKIQWRNNTQNKETMILCCFFKNIILGSKTKVFVQFLLCWHQLCVFYKTLPLQMYYQFVHMSFLLTPYIFKDAFKYPNKILKVFKIWCLLLFFWRWKYNTHFELRIVKTTHWIINF